MNIIIKYFPLCLVLSLNTAKAQQNLKNTVILYNVVPLRVDLNQDGTIQTIYGEDTKFLKGYTIVRPQTSPESAEYAQNKGYYVVSKDYYDINFSANSAILSENAVASLDKSSDMAFFGDHRIMISSYKPTEDSKSKTLFKNRMNACLMYLDLKGVSKDRIIINDEGLQSSEEFIKLTFVK